MKLNNLNHDDFTLLNSKPLPSSTILAHKDLISIVDRHFRFEYPDGHPLACEGEGYYQFTVIYWNLPVCSLSAVFETFEGLSQTARRVSMSRKSISPKRAEKLLENMKVLTPSRKPPEGSFSSDIENIEPTTQCAPSLRRLSRRSLPSPNLADCKILTPKVKHLYLSTYSVAVLFWCKCRFIASPHI